MIFCFADLLKIFSPAVIYFFAVVFYLTAKYMEPQWE